MKQITLYFSCGELSVPMTIHHELQGMLLMLIGKADAPLAQEMHGGKYVYHGRKYASYVFGDLCGDFTLAADRRVFRNAVSWDIRTIDDRIARAIPLGLEREDCVLLGQTLRTVRVVSQEQTLLTGSALLTLRTPLVLHYTDDMGKMRYLTPKDADFIDRLTANARRKCTALGAPDAADTPLAFSLIAPDAWQNTRDYFKSIPVKGNMGTLKIDTTPDVLSMLYHVGLGERGGQGFGLFDIDQALPPCGAESPSAR